MQECLQGSCMILVLFLHARFHWLALTCSEKSCKMSCKIVLHYLALSCKIVATFLAFYNIILTARCKNFMQDLASSWRKVVLQVLANDFCMGTVHTPYHGRIWYANDDKRDSGLNPARCEGCSSSDKWNNFKQCINRLVYHLSYNGRTEPWSWSWRKRWAYARSLRMHASTGATGMSYPIAGSPRTIR